MTKNGEQRDVPMNNTVKTALERLRSESQTEWLFTQQNDNRKPLRDVRKPFLRACREAGISDIRFHDLRHTAGSLLVMKGVDISTVQDILGHKDLKMTRRYAHLSPQHKARSVKVLDTIGHQEDTGQDFGKVVDIPKS